jgi:hypothetical protein
MMFDPSIKSVTVDEVIDRGHGDSFRIIFIKGGIIYTALVSGDGNAFKSGDVIPLKQVRHVTVASEGQKRRWGICKGCLPSTSRGASRYTPPFDATQLL